MMCILVHTNPLYGFTDVSRIHANIYCKSPNRWRVTCDNIQHKHTTSVDNSSMFCKSLLATKHCSKL